MENWKTDIENLEDVLPENARFAYEQSKLDLESTINIKNLIEDKAFKLLSVLIPIETLLIGAFLTYLNTSKSFLGQNWVVLNPLMVLIVLNVISIWFFIKILCPSKDENQYKTLGNYPKNLWKKDLMGKNEAQYIYFECKHHQNRIELNDKFNSLKMNRFRKGINTTYYSLFTSIIVSIVSILINIIFHL